MVDKLSATEKAVAELVATGAANREIASALHMSESRVKNTISAAYRVLQLPARCNHRVALALLVIEQQGERGDR